MKCKVVPGFRSGKLVAIRRVENNKRGWPQFLCKCDCGGESVVASCRLSAKKNQIRSCGCSHTDHQIKVNLARRLSSGEAACHAAYLMTRNSCARKRKLTWEIAEADWKRLSALPCHYCGAGPSNLSRGGYGRFGDYAYNGLDRVDNGVGYVLFNVVPCCKLCNQAKSVLTLNDFKAWITRVYEHTVIGEKGVSP